MLSQGLLTHKGDKVYSSGVAAGKWSVFWELRSQMVNALILNRICCFLPSVRR